MNIKWVKVVGVIAGLGSAAASFAANWASEVQQDAKIAKKVEEALAKTTEKES